MYTPTTKYGEETQEIILNLKSLTKEADHAIATHQLEMILEAFGWERVEEIVRRIYKDNEIIVDTILEVLTSREIMTNFNIPESK